MNYFTTGVVGLTTGTLSVLSVKSPQVYPTINPPAYTIAKPEEQHSPHTPQEPVHPASDPRFIKLPVYGKIEMGQNREIPRAVGFSTEGVVLIDLTEFLPSKSGA